MSKLIRLPLSLWEAAKAGDYAAEAELMTRCRKLAARRVAAVVSKGRAETGRDVRMELLGEAMLAVAATWRRYVDDKGATVETFLIAAIDGYLKNAVNRGLGAERAPNVGGEDKTTRKAAFERADPVAHGQHNKARDGAARDTEDREAFTERLADMGADADDGPGELDLAGGERLTAEDRASGERDWRPYADDVADRRMQEDYPKLWKRLVQYRRSGGKEATFADRYGKSEKGMRVVLQELTRGQSLRRQFYFEAVEDRDVLVGEATRQLAEAVQEAEDGGRERQRLRDAKATELRQRRRDRDAATAKRAALAPVRAQELAERRGVLAVKKQKIARRVRDKRQQAADDDAALLAWALEHCKTAKYRQFMLAMYFRDLGPADDPTRLDADPLPIAEYWAWLKKQRQSSATLHGMERDAVHTDMRIRYPGTRGMLDHFATERRAYARLRAYHASGEMDPESIADMQGRPP